MILLPFDALVLDGQRYFIDVVDLPQETSGSADIPIVLEFEDNFNHEPIDTTTPAELVIIDSDPPSPDQMSTSFTDESLKMAVENFGEHSELDSNFSIPNLKTF